MVCKHCSQVLGACLRHQSMEQGHAAQLEASAVCRLIVLKTSQLADCGIPALQLRVPFVQLSTTCYVRMRSQLEAMPHLALMCAVLDARAHAFRTECKLTCVPVFEACRRSRRAIRSPVVFGGFVAACVLARHAL